MEKIDLSLKEYNNIANLSPFYGSNGLDRLIEIHKNLIGKTCYEHCPQIEDCGVYFVANLLNTEYSRSFAYFYPEQVINFFKSSYLSDYFKNSILNLLTDEYLNEKLKCLLESKKDISEMAEEDIKNIKDAIKHYYDEIDKENKKSYDNISGYFWSYLLNLEGIGVKNYLKNNTDNLLIFNNVIYRSGLTPRANYYDNCDESRLNLNENNLYSIFVKLFSIDENYAISFVKMVWNMDLLTARELIINMENLAKDGFKDKCTELDINAIFKYCNINSMNDNNSQIIKKMFITKIYPILCDKVECIKKKTNSYK